VADIRKNKFEWLGHFIGIDQARVASFGHAS
jgi:hypothetical protein